MKSVFCSGIVMALVASTVVAAEGRPLRSALTQAFAPAVVGQVSELPMPAPLSPTPDPVYSQSLPSGVVTGYPVVSQPAPLFSDVRYRAVRNIAPNAVPTIIQVADPCDRCCKSCVSIEVCAPPCAPCDVKMTRDGNRVRYDFGKYAIVARTVGDHVVVHYHD